LNTRIKSDVCGLGCGTGALKITWLGLADSFAEGEDAEGFLDTAQGDVEGVAVFGLAEDAFQSELEEVQLIQERGLMVLPGFVRSHGHSAAQVFGVAGERREGKPVLGGHGTQGRPGLQSLGDLVEGRVSADGTAFIHGWPRFSARLDGAAGKAGGAALCRAPSWRARPASMSQNSDSREPVYPFMGPGASTGGTHDREELKAGD